MHFIYWNAFAIDAVWSFQPQLHLNVPHETHQDQVSQEKGREHFWN